MLTDDQARDLLRQAAETIEVGPARPVEPARRRRPVLVALAAAAAVAVAAGTTVALTRADTGPVGEPAGTPPPEQSSEGGPEPSPALEGVVPVVFGYDEGTARRLLEDAGAREVVTQALPGCHPPGRALQVRPFPGSRLDGSTRVRLSVTANEPGKTCLPLGEEIDEARFWALLDFARDTGPPPDLAPELTSAVNGEVVTLSDPADRSSWPDGSALDALARVPDLTEQQDLDAPRPVFGSSRDRGDGREGCPGASAGQDAGLPEGLAGRPSDAFWFQHQRVGEMGPCAVVNVFHDDGEVDAVVVRQLTWQAPAD